MTDIGKSDTENADMITAPAKAIAPGRAAHIQKQEESPLNFDLDHLPDPTLDSAANPLIKPLIQEDEEKKKNSFISKGQHIHKWSTYLTVDWIFNAAVGVSFAYWGKYSKLGKAVWSTPITETFTSVLKPMIKNPVLLEKSVGKGNMFMSIIAGGMFTLPPLMILESKKVKKAITQFYDELVYGKENVKNDPKFQECYDEIDNEPKKGFWTGMVSRGLALAPLLAIVLIPKTQKISDKLYFSHVAHASETVATTMGFSAKSFKNIPAEQAAERWKFIHDGVAMDFGLGIPYAVLHSFFYKQCAALSEKWFGKKENQEQAKHTAQSPVASGAASDATSAPESDNQHNINKTMACDAADHHSFAAKHKPLMRSTMAKAESFAANLETNPDMKQLAI